MNTLRFDDTRLPRLMQSGAIHSGYGVGSCEPDGYILAGDSIDLYGPGQYGPDDYELDFLALTPEEQRAACERNRDGYARRTDYPGSPACLCTQHAGEMRLFDWVGARRYF